MPAPDVIIERLAWTDPVLGEIACPGGSMPIRASFGSGLARRSSDPPGIVWGLGDRGPNLKIKTAVERYGLAQLEGLRELEGAKVMPRLDLGPAIAELRVSEDAVTLVRTLRLHGPDGRPISGIPMPGTAHAECEPAVSLDGAIIEPDESGADSEGIAALSDGSFIVGDEYGPSLMRVDAGGIVRERWMPTRGSDGIPVLPALANRRQLNRGFEGIALSPDERILHLTFQSPLAHPDEAAHEAADHVRIWSLDARTGAVLAQHLYRLDPPATFRRDCAKGPFGGSDRKLCEIACAGPDRLIVIERGSETTKLYSVLLDPRLALPPEHLNIATRPSVEELSASGAALPELTKHLLLSTDDHPEVASDMEGLAVLSPTELLLVSDNDFGVEGAETSFWRVRFKAPLSGA